MTAILRGAGAIVAFDGKTYNFGPGALSDSTPPEVVEILRKRGALRDLPADVASEVAPGEPPSDPDPLTLSVAALAAMIDGESLNAPATVALAGEDPARARMVIDAEQLAHGGDGRATVLKPLERLAARTP